MLDSSHYQRIIIDRYQFRGFHGCQAWCQLEILPLVDGRTVVIATEVKDNPGTSITNCAEHLAYWVCVEFAVDPSRLIWIEHYGYPGAINPKQPRTYDVVDFDILPPGHDAVFAHPRWRPMRLADWQALGLEPRV
jgi:hypothetical protein